MPTGDRGTSDLKRLMGSLGSSKAADALEGMEALEAQFLPSDFLKEITGVSSAVGRLADKVIKLRPSLEDHLKTSAFLVDSDHDQSFGELVDFSGYNVIEFFQQTAGWMHNHAHVSYSQLFRIAAVYELFLKNVANENAEEQLKTLGDTKRVSGALRRVLEMVVDQIVGPIASFRNPVIQTYESIQKQHAFLKHKYEGVGDDPNDDADDPFTRLLKEMQGQKKDKTPNNGPKIELYRDNSLLTDLLADAVKKLPRRYEKIVPVRLGGKTKVIKSLDERDVERVAEVWMGISNKRYFDFLNDPNSFFGVVADSMTAYYKHYREFEPLIWEIVNSTRDVKQIFYHVREELRDKKIGDPREVIKKIMRYNFLNIRPSGEETAPRNRVEKDYAIARRKLVHHIYTTLENLTMMPASEETAKMDLAVKSVREAVALKGNMDEILQSEHDKRLRANIREENEFYVGGTGQIGAFVAHREPAPTIKYKDVKGASFDRAREHIEEVIGISSFPHLLKASSPRGTLKSNILLIGPYGCGKSELGRAVAGDKRTIGLYVDVSDVLTAYLHESVKNVKRVWEAARDLRRESRYTKPVALIQDEFDAWFVRGDEKTYSSTDMGQIKNTLQTVMDGIVDYEGVFMVALTNNPRAIPDAILRRFKYVDVVGQLTDVERTDLFKHFLSRGLPISSGIRATDYARWTAQLADAPGDVFGKIADEVHFKFMREYLGKHRDEGRRIERYLHKMSQDGDLTRREFAYVKRHLGQYRSITPNDVNSAVDYMLKQPAVQKEINAARKVYADAAEVMKGLAEVTDDSPSIGFNAKRRSTLWNP